jgi:predicted Zn finger-like uncharacterized protein
MKFRTTCSHCESVFLLTADQLEAVQGWAQCGVCGAAFNARSTLASENGDPLPVEIVAPEVEAVTDPVSMLAPEIPNETAPPGTDETPHPTLIPETSPVSQLAGIEARVAQPDLTSIILIDPDAEVTDDYGPLPVFSATSNIEGGTNDARSIYGPTYSAPAAIAKPAKQVFTSQSSIDPPKTATRSTRAPSRLSKVLWVLLILILVVTLKLQLAYFLRDFIALKIPAARPWLEDACAQLGCTLSLPKDAEWIQIIGSDLQAEPAGSGHLQLKLTLGNRAPYTQAWPVIVLTLTDAKDQPQARRSFAPSEYLADQKLLAAGIPAQSEHLLSLPLAVRNLPMAGYHLEIAY